MKCLHRNNTHFTVSRSNVYLQMGCEIRRVYKHASIQSVFVCMCSCIFGSGLWGHEEIDLHLRVVSSSKSFLLCRAMGRNERCEKYQVFKRQFQRSFHGHLEMENRWKHSILETAKVSDADGFKRRWDHRLCPLLKMLPETETSWNYRGWRSLRFIKLLNQSFWWDSKLQRAQHADQN